MKLSALATSLLVVTVAARSGFRKTSAVLPYDDSLAVPGDNPLQHCQDPTDDILELTSVDLSPNPPLPGQNLSVKATGTLHTAVEDGAKVHLSVKYGLITIIKQTADLCDTVQNVDLSCPLDEGELTFSKDIAIPREIPPGKYTVLADVVSKDEEKITCLTATVEFKRGGGAGAVEIVEALKEKVWKQDI